MNFEFNEGDRIRIRHGCGDTGGLRGLILERGSRAPYIEYLVRVEGSTAGASWYDQFWIQPLHALEQLAEVAE